MGGWEGGQGRNYYRGIEAEEAVASLLFVQKMIIIINCTSCGPVL